MKLSGKYFAEINSSFVEFDVDALPTLDEQNEIKANQSCNEAIWMGKSQYIQGRFSIMLGFDEMSSDDLDLLKPVLSEEDFNEIKWIKNNNY